MPQLSNTANLFGPLQTVRMLRGLSLHSLAANLEISPDLLDAYEREELRVPFSDAVRFCEILQCSPAALFPQIAEDGLSEAWAQFVQTPPAPDSPLLTPALLSAFREAGVELSPLVYALTLNFKGSHPPLVVEVGPEEAQAVFEVLKNPSRAVGRFLVFANQDGYVGVNLKRVVQWCMEPTLREEHYSALRDELRPNLGEPYTIALKTAGVPEIVLLSTASYGPASKRGSEAQDPSMTAPEDLAQRLMGRLESPQHVGAMECMTLLTNSGVFGFRLKDLELVTIPFEVAVPTEA